MTVVFEADVVEPYRLRSVRWHVPVTVCILVFSLVYLVDALQAYLYVLQGVEENHELLHRSVELSYDVLHGKHHSESQLTVDYCRCRHHRNNDVLKFVDEYAACLLCLLKLETSHLHVEKVCLSVLPFPAAATAAVLKLYLLHGCDELISLVGVYRLLLEQFVVKHLAASEKRCYP